MKKIMSIIALMFVVAAIAIVAMPQESTLSEDITLESQTIGFKDAGFPDLMPPFGVKFPD